MRPSGALRQTRLAGDRNTALHKLLLAWHIAPSPEIRHEFTACLALPEIGEWGDAALRLFVAALAHHGRPINGAKTDDTRRRRIDKAIDLFAAGKKR